MSVRLSCFSSVTLFIARREWGARSGCETAETRQESGAQSERETPKTRRGSDGRNSTGLGQGGTTKTRCGLGAGWAACSAGQGAGERLGVVQWGGGAVRDPDCEAGQAMGWLY